MRPYFCIISYFFHSFMGGHLSVLGAEDWTIIDAKMPVKDTYWKLGHNPLGDSNSIYLIGGHNNPYSRYLFQIDSETFLFLGNDLQSPGFVDEYSNSRNSIALKDKIYWGSSTSSISSFQMSPENTRIISYGGKPYSTFWECLASDRDDHIFLLGGRSAMSSGEIDYFQIYEVSTNTWKTGPRLNWKYSVMGCEVSSVTKRIYTFGGYNRYDKYASDERMKDKIQSIGLDLSIFNKRKAKKGE